MGEFTKPIRYGDRGVRVRDAEFALHAIGNRFEINFRPGPIDGLWGKQAIAAADEARYELGYPLDECASGVFGQELFDFLRRDASHHRLPAAYVARRLRRRGTHLIRRIPLPGYVHYPNVSYPPGSGRWGLQPWISPQVEEIAKHFGLVVTAGYGGHPPHGYYSDHRWGGAGDLAGSLRNMDACTFWADGYASGFYRRGKVFRWVGGPAHDANGVEAGHYNHVHLSWYRLGPATSIFDSCPLFGGRAGH